MRALLCCLGCLLVLGAAPAAVKAADYEAQITQLDHRSEFPTIALRVAVTDAQGRPVSGLRWENFKLVESRAPIAKFTVSNAPSGNAGQEYQLTYVSPQPTADGNARSVVVVVDLATTECRAETSYTPTSAMARGGQAVPIGTTRAPSTDWTLFILIVALAIVALFLPSLWEWALRVTRQTDDLAASGAPPSVSPPGQAGYAPSAASPMGAPTPATAAPAPSSPSGVITIVDDDLGIRVHESTAPAAVPARQPPPPPPV